MLTIGIDIDDTLTDTTCLIKKKFKESKNKELIDNMEDIIRGYYVSDTSIEFYKSIASVFANDIKIKSGVKEALSKLHNDGYKIIIITARNDNYYGDAYKICYDYLIKNDVVFDKLLIGRTYKIETCKDEKIDIIIDDSIDVVNKAIDEGIDAILITSILNKDRECKVSRFDDWDSIYEYITKKFTDKV